MEEDISLKSKESKDTINTIINNIIDSRIKNLLEIISLNYSDKFNKKLIENEYEYIKKHVILDKQKIANAKKKIINIKKIKQTKQTKQTSEPLVKKRIIINIEEQCSGRVWNDFIFFKKNMKKINDIEDKYKVLDYKYIDLKSFTDKYIIGSRCSNAKIKDEKYCNLHSKHLIHGDYLEIPSKELCYHFIKDGKYL